MKLFYVSLMMLLICHVSSPLVVSHVAMTPRSVFRVGPADRALRFLVACRSFRAVCPEPPCRAMCDSLRPACFCDVAGGSMSSGQQVVKRGPAKAAPS